MMACPKGPLSGGCRGQNERDLNLKILKIETVTVTIPVIQIDSADRDNAPGSGCAGPPHYIAA